MVSFTLILLIVYQSEATDLHFASVSIGWLLAACI